MCIKKKNKKNVSRVCNKLTNSQISLSLTMFKLKIVLYDILSFIQEYLTKKIKINSK